jgi:hypothetical protein
MILHISQQLNGGMVEWLMHQTSNLRGLKTLSGASRCFLKKETLHSLLNTGWFQERIQECVYKLIASHTIKVK